jgi:hypothetical protein
MRHVEVQKVATKKPFRPFVVEMVDGHSHPFNSPEGFVITPSAIYTADQNHDLLILSMDMISRIIVREPQGEARGS